MTRSVLTATAAPRPSGRTDFTPRASPLACKRLRTQPHRALVAAAQGLVKPTALVVPERGKVRAPWINPRTYTALVPNLVDQPVVAHDEFSNRGLVELGDHPPALGQLLE